jgi:hypothetical protein
MIMKYTIRKWGGKKRLSNSRIMSRKRKNPNIMFFSFCFVLRNTRTRLGNKMFVR